MLRLLLAGSPDVDLGQAVVEISDSTVKYVLRYGSDTCDDAAVNGDVFGVTNFGDADDFDLIVLQDADGSCVSATPVINFGDHVIVAIDADGIDEVYLNIRNPSGIVQNFSITENKSGYMYYCNKTYSDVGDYYFFIWTNDIIGNTNISDVKQFSIIFT